MDCECFCHSTGKEFCEACWTEHDLDEGEAACMHALDVSKTLRIFQMKLVRIARPEDLVN